MILADYPCVRLSRRLNESELFPRRIEHNWKSDRDREIVFREYAANLKIALDFQFSFSLRLLPPLSE